MRIKNYLAMILAGGMLASTQAQAVTYLLDQSNVDNWGIFPDGGGPYVSVTLEEIGSAVQFTVDVVDSEFQSLNSFGIQHFAFNIADSTVLPDSPPNTGSVWGLPLNWTADASTPPPNTADGFGKFDVKVSTSGQNDRQDPLIFTIDNIAGDTVASYFAPSSDSAGEGNAWFAAHVAGFETGIFRPDGYDSNSGVTCDPEVITDGSCNEITSAWFGGGDGDGFPPAGVIPVPASVWLFGSGLLGLVGIARRKRS